MDAQQWFEETYRQYVDLLFRVGRRFGGNTGDEALCDLIQDVFLMLWNRREELMHHPNIGGWLVEALKYRVLGSRSKLTRRSLHHAYSLDEEEAAPIADGGATPEDHVALGQHADAIRALLGEEDGNLFLNYVLGKRSTEELARALGVSRSCIWMRVARLKKKLAQHPDVFFTILPFLVRLALLRGITK